MSKSFEARHLGMRPEEIRARLITDLVRQEYLDRRQLEDLVCDVGEFNARYPAMAIPDRPGA